MAATINDFISALHSASTSFSCFEGQGGVCQSRGGAVVSRTTHFADGVVECLGRRYMLSLPLTTEGHAMAQRAAVKLRLFVSPLFLEYRLLRSAMSYVDACGQAALSDILLHEIPFGPTLSEGMMSCEASRLFAAIDTMEREFARLDFVHSNLTPENIIITPENHLYPLRLHYSVVGGGQSDEFDSLRSAVATAHGVEIPMASLGEPLPLECDLEGFGYSNVGNLFEGLRVAQSGDLYGYINDAGQMIIPAQFLWAGDMCEGRAEVQTPDGMGLIDAQGEYIIEPHFEIVEFDVRTGHSRVRKNGEWATYDYEGRLVCEECSMV